MNEECQWYCLAWNASHSNFWHRKSFVSKSLRCKSSALTVKGLDILLEWWDVSKLPFQSVAYKAFLQSTFKLLPIQFIIPHLSNGPMRVILASFLSLSVSVTQASIHIVTVGADDTSLFSPNNLVADVGDIIEFQFTRDARHTHFDPLIARIWPFPIPRSCHCAWQSKIRSPPVLLVPSGLSFITPQKLYSPSHIFWRYVRDAMVSSWPAIKRRGSKVCYINWRVLMIKTRRYGWGQRKPWQIAIACGISLIEETRYRPTGPRNHWKWQALPKTRSI